MFGAGLLEHVDRRSSRRSENAKNFDTNFHKRAVSQVREYTNFRYQPRYLPDNIVQV